MDCLSSSGHVFCKVGVMGLGYVGLPLAVQMARSGYRVVGFDADDRKITQLQRGESYVAGVPDTDLAEVVESGTFSPSGDFSLLSGVDAVSICVPTPLSKSHDPDLSYIRAAADQIIEHFRRGLLIVLESTTYPGTTEEIIVEPLTRMGYEVGKDFFVCFSPERVDPGNHTYETKNTPKIIGGVTPECLRAGMSLYSSVIDHLVPVSSTRVAETAKLLENTYRSVNIALVNEIAVMCEKMSIDVWEVIKAASSKPFGFSAFRPGPGTGGHCIPLDPIYLSWKARTYGYYARMITTATEINSSMPSHVCSKIAEALNLIGKSLRGARVVVLGVSYKRDVDDIRESPALEIIQKLSQAGSLVSYVDPYIPELEIGGQSLECLPLCPSVLSEADCVVVITDHSVFDYQMIADNASLIVDTRNSVPPSNHGLIVSLGRPMPSLY